MARMLFESAFFVKNAGNSAKDLTSLWKAEYNRINYGKQKDLLSDFFGRKLQQAAEEWSGKFESKLSNLPG